MTYDLVCERKGRDVKITGPSDVYPLVKRYATKMQEHFLILTLNTAQEVIRVHLVSLGLLSRTLISPREVFARCLKDHAASLILAHSHPSGNLEPSREDREATRRLCDAGSLMGVPVLDHLIFTKSGYYSFKESGDMPLNISLS